MTVNPAPAPRSLVDVVTRGSLGADPAAFIVLEVRDAFRARGLDPDPAILLRAMAEVRATAAGWDPADDPADVEGLSDVEGLGDVEGLSDVEGLGDDHGLSGGLDAALGAFDRRRQADGHGAALDLR